MTDKKKTEELNEQDLDAVQGGNMEIQNLANAKTGDGSVRTADEFLSSGHTTGSNITGTGKGVVTEEIVFVFVKE
jgi:hypothetical protein